MPKRRPMDFLRRLGRRMRARRLFLSRTRNIVANAAEISVTQLAAYEAGQGHPPAATLYRIAQSLGTSTCALLGEEVSNNSEQFDVLVKLYSDPMIGAVTRYMQDMTVDERKSVQVIAGAIAGQKRPVKTVEVMR